VLKKLLVILFLFFITPAVFAVEEIQLEKKSLNLDYLSDLYYGKVDNFNEIHPSIRLFSKKGLEFQSSKINSVKLNLLFVDNFTYSNTEKDNQFAHNDFNTVEPMITVKFNENRSKAMFSMNLTRELDDHSNWFTQRISQIYVSHDITKNQTILLGQANRLPSSIDGRVGIFDREMVIKSQLGRTFGDARSVGIRNIANYKFFEYDVGLYDSTRYMRHFGNGIDFTGHITVKPFENFSENIGRLKFGAGYNIGHNNFSYNMYSFFARYDYKKVHIQTEYANADGYNGLKESNNKAQGFYTMAYYDITPKLSIIARYDIFDSDKNISNNNSTEYSAGFTYKIFKNWHFLLNFVRRNIENKPDSNMILFATRFII
jgi:hypothetical protein